MSHSSSLGRPSCCVPFLLPPNPEYTLSTLSTTRSLPKPSETGWHHSLQFGHGGSSLGSRRLSRAPRVHRAEGSVYAMSPTASIVEEGARSRVEGNAARSQSTPVELDHPVQIVRLRPPRRSSVVEDQRAVVVVTKLVGLAHRRASKRAHAGSREGRSRCCDRTSLQFGSARCSTFRES